MARLPLGLTILSLLVSTRGLALGQPADAGATSDSTATADPADATPAPAAADSPDPTGDTASDRAPASDPNDPGWHYLIDGGAIPFVYGAALVAAGAELTLHPPDTPLLFDPDEGGAEKRHETLPYAYMAVFATTAAAGIIAIPNDSRWYHFKGITEALLTTMAVAGITKNVFGRHRPYYDPATSTSDFDRRSFFSAHAAVTLATTTYVGLYLHQHLMTGARKWEPLALTSLAAISVYVPYTRWADHMHHPSDLYAGAGVGAAAAVGFYLWQERRYQRAHRRLAGSRTGRPSLADRLIVAPDLANRGLTLLLSF